jgi:hypothetical protein
LQRRRRDPAQIPIGKPRTDKGRLGQGIAYGGTFHSAGNNFHPRYIRHQLDDNGGPGRILKLAGPGQVLLYGALHAGGLKKSGWFTSNNSSGPEPLENKEAYGILKQRDMSEGADLVGESPVQYGLIDDGFAAVEADLCQ